MVCLCLLNSFLYSQVELSTSRSTRSWTTMPSGSYTTRQAALSEEYMSTKISRNFWESCWPWSLSTGKNTWVFISVLLAASISKYIQDNIFLDTRKSAHLPGSDFSLSSNEKSHKSIPIIQERLSCQSFTPCSWSTWSSLENLSGKPWVKEDGRTTSRAQTKVSFGCSGRPWRSCSIPSSTVLFPKSRKFEEALDCTICAICCWSADSRWVRTFKMQWKTDLDTR